MGATVRVNSNESPTLNGDYRALNSITNLDTYSDQGWTMEVDARKVSADIPSQESPQPEGSQGLEEDYELIGLPGTLKEQLLQLIKAGWSVINLNKNPYIPFSKDADSWIELDFRDEENNPVATKVLISQGGASVEKIIKGPTLLIPVDESPVKLKVIGKDLYYTAMNGKKRAWQGGVLKYDVPQKASTLSDDKNPVQAYTKKEMGGLGKKTEKEYVLIKTSNTLNPAPPARAFGPNANKTLMFVDKEYNLLANHSYVFEVKALRKEYIAVAGCPYDKSEKNKLLFPAQAVRMMRLLQGGAPDFKAAKKDSDCLITKQGHKLTILLMNVPVDDKQKEYTDEQLAVVAESCTAYDVDFIEMDNLTELIGYINNTNRESYLVEELTFFSHGRPSVLGEMPPDNKDVFGIALGDGTAQKHALNFNSEQGIKLQGAAFSADAEIKAFACRTGTGVYDSDKVEPLDPSGVPGGGGGLNWKTEVSQAQTMANAIRRVMWAYVCKSDYEDAWGSKVDRAQYWGFCPQFDPAVPVDSNDFSFCIQFGKLDNERRENIGKINANWNSIGALYSVKAGTNPPNAPKDYRMFIPR